MASRLLRSEVVVRVFFALCAAIGGGPGLGGSGGPEGGLTAIDLSDHWAPAIFSETPPHPQPYRPTFLALANERLERAGETARRDRYFELFGIFPSISVIRGRLLDEERHLCHARIDDAPLRTGEKWEAGPSLAAMKAHLACDGLLVPGSAPDRFDGATAAALRLYQRRHMLPSAGRLDGETRAALLAGSRELDFRSLLRALRERVSDATGLIEDGSALGAWEPILGRFIDAEEYRRPMRAEPIPGGAPDLLDRATEVAAIALGWTSPENAARALAEPPPLRALVHLPPLPAYHSRPVRLRAEIDRGDVWISRPIDAQGRRRRSPVKDRPTFTLFVETPEGERALVRWPTTIGSWQPELVDGVETLRYKPSPVGRRYWRDLMAAPAWFPPLSTPDRELVRRGPDGAWGPDRDAVGPGHRSAYGLVALFHHRAPDDGGPGLELAGGAAALVDDEIRTHGSGNYRSILRGSSHGCHRLFNHLALRLGSYLVQHSHHTRHGSVPERYVRMLEWHGHRIALRAASRGYRYELSPPIPVDVLPGRIVRSRPKAPAAPNGEAPAAPAPAPQAAPTEPRT